MGKEGSVAPKERINVKYVPATGDQQEEIELPLRLMVLGNFTGQTDETPVEDRQVLSVDKNSFATILEDTNIEREVTVKNTLIDEEDAELTASIKIKSMADFGPDSIVQQVPDLKSLADLREALVALKNMGQIEARYAWPGVVDHNATAVLELRGADLDGCSGFPLNILQTIFDQIEKNMDYQ